MSTRRIIVTSVLALGALTSAVKAADAPAAKWYDKVTLGGYVEAYYQQGFTESGSSMLAVTPRAFDTKQNQFQFGGGELTFATADDKSKTSYYLDLLMGPKADVVNANNGLAASNFMVGQAFVTKTLGDAKFSFGKFVTPLGTEVISTPGNLNYSRSILFGSIPYYEVGLKVDYTLPASFVLTGMLDNGNSVDSAANNGKGYGAMLTYSGIKGLSLMGCWYSAPVIVAGDLSNQHFLDVVGGYTFTDTLSINAEYLYTTTLDPKPATTTPVMYTPVSPKTQGYAVYVNWTTPMAGLSVIPRFEQYYQPDANNTDGGLVPMGYGTVDNSSTLTLKYADGPLTHYLEYRADASNLYKYAGSKPADPMTQIQQTVTYAAMYGF